MDYIQDIEAVKSWAKDLLILQYHQSPKNRAMVDLMVDLVFANDLVLKIRDLCLNVEESIGAQLDVVGKWVGIDRYYDAIDLWSHPYTALVNYSNVADDTYLQWQGGYSNYTNFDDNDGGYLTYKVWRDVRTKVNQIGDEYFRQLIKLKIIKNSIRFTNKNIDDAIWEWSNGEIYTTWDVMEVTYHYPSEASNLMQLAIYKDVLIAPTGCAIKTEVIQ
ncbi:MAG: DUF2612 domain-containing protein [Alphaproteobacteria bacterium]|nr:DUF2612 domain-containing protein [Alphaproteobacteria bacterium]MBQ3946373.1 DUF2612 domain-containing protein [Alphaproteobacteria bacterium]